MMSWNFAFGKCYGRGALNRFLVILTLIETRAVLIMKVSPGAIFSCAGFQLLPILDFCSHGISVLMSNPGEGVEYDTIFIARTVTL